jgi:ABC-type lipoprotein release transport system permease subunit
MSPAAQMGRKRTSRIITFGGMGAIAALVAFMVLLQVSNAKNNDFRKSIDSIAFDAVALTQEYQAEESKWTNKQYDNSTMITIVDNYLPKYQQLIDRANMLDTPDRYKEARGFLVSAIQSEKESNEHFRNYLVTGDQKEYERSSDLLTKSLAESASYDATIRAAG